MLQISLLLKGPKFTPTTKSKLFSVKSDLKEFTRKLIIHEQFYDKEYSDESLVKDKSNREMFTSNPLLSNVVQQINNFVPGEMKVKYNITKKEHNALEELKSNNKTIIKSADKGSCLVLMDADYYRDKLVYHDHLLTETYKKVASNTDEICFKKLKNHVDKFKECLTKKEITYLKNYEWKTSNFYVLPKIHESNAIENFINESIKEYIECLCPDDLNGRPIVGGSFLPTQRLSELVEKILSPLVPKLTTYIKDDWHFIRVLPNNMEYQNTTLYSVDISNLYTSISHELGLEAIKFWISKLRDDIPIRFSEAFILESVNFILKNNNFTFNNEFFNQLIGTSVETKMAPPYACLVVGYLEKVKLFPKVLPIFFNKIECENIQNNFKRYIDDGFVALLKSINVNLLIKCLNSLHPDIKNTEEQSKISYTNTSQYQFLNFLDKTVILHDNNIIETDIFYKPTNSHDYLNYKSHHPKHTKENILFTLAKRIICFVSNPIKMEIRLQ
ncbi:uncharacterized protein LOC136079116 [Hydra vulgaris]|uniref:Uncharacterized protein LOC136079116 n=1 Tax=Hydra vulgaris TaxID=6087 RepID=A0ABM4BP69_HYDVU